MPEEKRTERISEKLRALADILDKNPVLEQFPELFSYSYFRHIGQHLGGDESAQIDRFAAAVGVEVEHGPLVDGKRYSHAEVEIDGVCFRFQARTEDYEQATGKTVDNGGAQ